MYFKFQPIQLLTINSDLYQLRIPLHHVVLAVVSMIQNFKILEYVADLILCLRNLWYTCVRGGCT